jgi:hypothetical protein
MKLFLIDLWADLRERRLWPVAVLLVVGLVAVPLVVANPARDPQPQGPDPAEQAKLAKPPGVEVVAAKNDAGAGSALDLFDPRDPFRPPQKVVDASEPKEAPSGGGGGAGAADKGSTDGSSGGTPSSGGDTGGGSAPPTTAPKPPVVKTEQYAYVVDLFFRSGERTRHIKSFRRLGFLPSEQNPLLLFLGVSQDLNNAVFLVDSTLEAHGEGSCKPQGDKCSLLYLGAGELHYFTEEDGDTYALQVDQIRRVKVSGRASAKGSSKRPQGSSKRPQARRSFVPPILSDLVSVATKKRAR